MNFIYFTTINKQVLQRALISLVSTGVSASSLMMWEEAGISDKTHVSKRVAVIQTLDHGDRARVAAVRSECTVHCTTWNNTRSYPFNNFVRLVYELLSVFEIVYIQDTCICTCRISQDLRWYMMFIQHHVFYPKFGKGKKSLGWKKLLLPSHTMRDLFNICFSSVLMSRFLFYWLFMAKDLTPFQ